jgi:hypothetical protein
LSAKGAAQLLASPEAAHSANGGFRAIALKRTQQTHGNQFAQRVVRSIQRKPILVGSVQRKNSNAAADSARPGPTQKSSEMASPARIGYFKAAGYASESGDSQTPVVALAKSLENATVTEPNDPTEFEADRVAEAAVSSPLQVSDHIPENSGQPQAVPVSGSQQLGGLDTGSGSPLSGNVRQKVEPLLGADLGQVRVHSDASAQQAAADLQAKAFTHSNHIWLGANQSPEDVSLLAHEATHVVQQTTDRVEKKSINRK